MTDDDRARLVEELAEAMYGAVTFDGGYAVGKSELAVGATACLPIIEKLLAAHDLDALLDSVHPQAAITRMERDDELIEQVAKAIKNADQTTWKHTQEYHTFEDSAWEEMVDDTERVPYEGISLGRDHFRTMAAASIPLVRADEQRRIAAALLSEEAVEAAAKAGISEWDAYVPDGPVHQGARIMAKEQMEAALTAIGIRKETENVE